jgi:hypothetical protein
MTGSTTTNMARACKAEVVPRRRGTLLGLGIFF